MSKFLISFGANAMDHLPDEVMPDVAEAARAVVREIIDAGVYVVAGALGDRRASTVATDGTVTEGPEPEDIGAVTIVDVPTREEAFEWAAKIAVACRCAQEVWEIRHDPELEAILHQADGRR
ncbi:MAG: YciI family protein [Acidimicrobiales bacterium]